MPSFLSVLFLLGLGLLALPLSAQDSPGLSVAEVELATRTDVYGLRNIVALGDLANTGEQAVTGITLFADVYGADNTLIGEGFGYLVNACGAGLLPDFALQPDHTQPFEVVLELYDPDITVARVEIRPQGSPTEPTPLLVDAIPGITQIADVEVAAVEWVDSRSLRYARGCTGELFTEMEWMHYSGRTGVTLPVVHPRASDITPLLVERMNVTEPGEISESMLTFAPTGTRLVYQGDINRLYTTELDGSFQRVVNDRLYNRTLQGILWASDAVFLAYYYGAPGDPVYYLTASSAGQPISMNPNNLPLSGIVPGVSPDGRRAVISGTFDDRTGYFLESLVNNMPPQLLFEADPPGNNWPAPLFHVTPSENGGQVAHERVYIARPVDGEARLQCYSLQYGGPFDLSTLPLNLGLDERAQWWLSPDGATLALAANGARGGLWLIDLASLPACEG